MKDRPPPSASALPRDGQAEPRDDSDHDGDRLLAGQPIDWPLGTVAACPRHPSHSILGASRWPSGFEVVDAMPRACAAEIVAVESMGLVRMTWAPEMSPSPRARGRQGLPDDLHGARVLRRSMALRAQRS